MRTSQVGLCGAEAYMAEKPVNDLVLPFTNNQFCVVGKLRAHNIAFVRV